METTWWDIRYGLRMMRKNPAYTVTAIIALMLGIASTTVIFSVVYGVLLRALPYPDSQRLVVLAQTLRPSEQEQAISPANFIDWTQQNDVFSAIAAGRGWQGNLNNGDLPERVRSTMVTPSFFQVFSTPPLLGRRLTEADARPGSSNVVVLSYPLWQRRFGGDRNIVGRQIRFEGEPHTIVGVMPASFTPDDYGELWTTSPYGVPTHALRPLIDPRTLRDSNYLDAWGKLKPGVTLAQARTEMSAIMMRLEHQYPDSNNGTGIMVTPLQEEMASGLRPPLLVLASAVGFLLLIACANVANLQLARAATRLREVSIRTALGASRGRLVRQLLTESLLLALIGGALGIVLAAWTIPVLLAFAPMGLVGFGEINLSRGVLIFSVALSILTGVLFGLAPAFLTSSVNPGESLGEGERGSTSARSGGRSVLIATEVGLTVVLLIAAALMVKSFSHLTRVDPGFKAENLLIFDIGLSPGTDEAHNRAFYEAVSERLVGLPGVERVGAVSRLPMSGGNSTRDFNVLGREKSQSADIRVITPDYFRTMGIPLLRGRAFNTHDIKTSAPIAVINEACAREIFPDEDPLGKFVVNFGPDKETLQIIGVVGNIRHLALDVAPRAELYQPIGQAMWPRMFFALRSVNAAPLALLPAVQTAIRGIDSNVALGNPRTMEDVIARSLTNRRFTMNLLGIFAGIAVALASIGLYGVMSYSVAQRTREIGIRMAVGAQRGHVLRLVIRQGMILTALGVAIGLVAAFALTRLMSKLLYAVSATDLTTFIGVSAMLALVALLACWLPARRASGVDPMVALRAE
jgi:putative ABC transport system permease protein